MDIEPKYYLPITRKESWLNLYSMWIYLPKIEYYDVDNNRSFHYYFRNNSKLEGIYIKKRLNKSNIKCNYYRIH